MSLTYAFELNFFSFYSEVKIYDPSGDSTIPSTSKKRKFEEVADDDDDDEPETPAAKIKKPKKELVQGVCVIGGEPSIFNVVCDAEILIILKKRNQLHQQWRLQRRKRKRKREQLKLRNQKKSQLSQR